MEAHRILIDARLSNYRRGMGSYVYHVMSELHRINTEHHISILVPASELEKYVNQFPRFSIFPTKFNNIILDEQITLPLLAKLHQFNIVHSPANTAPLLLPRFTKLVLTIHDVIYLLNDKSLPQPNNLYQQFGKHYRRMTVPPAARKACVVLTDSVHSKQDILHTIRLPESKVKVIYPAGNYSGTVPLLTEQEVETILALYGVRKPYILHLGAIDPRKNLQRMIEAYATLPPAVHQQAPQLVVVGLPPEGQIRAKELATSFDAQARIICLPFVAQHELQALYQAAALFAYPSMYEGFGLPLLEAMVLGTPVISSRVGSIPEVAGKAAILIDPTSVEELREALVRVLTDQSLREQLIEQGFVQSARFSWQRTAAEILDVYNSLTP
ncbi:MAG: glycosyltransferase family 4 protein [Chloroflexota bacterium]|nr:glycosyltransferase family 4 protein [Chloroflexota bacterium]